MKEASDALWWLSKDPNSRQLAEMREMSEQAHRHTMAAERQEGHQEGRQEGQLEGRRAVLIRQLELRFGPLSPEQAACLENATSEQLDAWTERVLTEATIDGILPG
jgi:flagellar biosynthesis/type III secretory pathway protein FliH